MNRPLRALTLALALGACGRAGPPVAPETRLPQPVTDLHGEVQGGAIELSWTNPTRRVDNTRLRDLRVARVFRAEDSGEGEPRLALLSRGRIAGYTELAIIRFGPSAPEPAPGSAVIQGHQVRLADREGLTFGRRYSYVVVTEDASGRVSSPSARISLTLIVSPEAPLGLRADAGENAARLRWRPPERLADGSPLTGELTYDVLRAPAADAPLEVVTPAPLATTELLDRSLENDRTYYYSVRARRHQAGVTALGPPSARVAVTPRDFTPPSTPTELIATPAADGVRLSWRASPEPDVAAYVIYRAGARGDFVRVGSARAPTTVFVDRDVPRGTYRYVVTALDGGAQPNESARSGVVTVTVP